MGQLQCKALIFDMDGVLVDTSPSHASAYATLWDKLSIEGPDYSEIAGRSTINVIDEYAYHLSIEQRQQAVVFKQMNALERLKTADIAFNDTVSALEVIAKHPMKMALATSASKASSALVLDRLNARRFFQSVTTGEDVKNAKPAPDLFLHAIQSLDCDTNDAVIIEDSQSGIDAALASGAKVLSVRNSDIVAKHPHYLGHFNNLAEMTNYLSHELGWGEMSA